MRNRDYLAQKAVLARVEPGALPVAKARTRIREWLDAEVAALAGG